MKDVETTRVTDGLLPLSSSVVRYVGAAAPSKGEKGRLHAIYCTSVWSSFKLCNARTVATQPLQSLNLDRKTGSGSEDESSVRLHEALK